MEPESDNSNSDHPAAAAGASDEQIHALIGEKEQLAADLAQSKSALEASEREIAGAQRKIQELTAERDQLVGEKTRAHAALAVAERDLAAIRSQVRELTQEKNRLAAAKERAQANAESAHNQLRALDGESIFGFVKRRYFTRK